MATKSHYQIAKSDDGSAFAMVKATQGRLNLCKFLKGSLAARLAGWESQAWLPWHLQLWLRHHQSQEQLSASWPLTSSLLVLAFEMQADCAAALAALESHSR